MNKDFHGLFTDGADEPMSQNVADRIPLPTEGYGLARTLAAAPTQDGLSGFLDQHTWARLEQDVQEMACIAAQTMAAQDAISEIYHSTLFCAEASIAAVEQVKAKLNATPGRSAFEEFDRMQRAQLLAWLNQIADQGAYLILAEIL